MTEDTNARDTLPTFSREKGIGRPNTTAIPDTFIDEIMPFLSGTEVKVMIYVYRRTFGFKKDGDPISYTQFLHGIIRKDGRRLDYGAGVSDRSLTRALDSLCDKWGLLFRHRRRRADGTSETTVYEPNIDGYPHYGESDDPRQSEEPNRKNAGVLPNRKNAGVDPRKITVHPSPQNYGNNMTEESQHTDQQHTEQPTAVEDGKGADALCVSEKDTYPTSSENAISEKETQPNKCPQSPQDNATGRKSRDSTSDRVNTFTSAKKPVDGLQSQIEARLKSVRIGAAKARDLATRLIREGRDLDYVERWITFVAQERKTNPAGFLVTVLGELAELPPTTQEQTQDHLTAEKYTTGKYAHIFNRQPPDKDSPPAAV